MKSQKNLLFVFAFVFFALFALAACGSEATPTKTNVPACSGGSVELTQGQNAVTLRPCGGSQPVLTYRVRSDRELEECQGSDCKVIDLGIPSGIQDGNPYWEIRPGITVQAVILGKSLKWDSRWQAKK